MFIRKSIMVASLALSALALTACNDSSKSKEIENSTSSIYQEGVHYRTVDKPLKYVDNEVTEFFWYGCPHCYSVEPVINKWELENSDHSLKKVHSQLSNRWIFDANVFFGLNEVNRMDLSKRYFDLRQQGYFKTNSDLNSWLSLNSIDPVLFFENLKKQEVVDYRKELSEKERSIGAGGVPAFLVEGKYLVLINGLSKLGGWNALPDILNYLSSIDDKK